MCEVYIYIFFYGAHLYNLRINAHVYTTLKIFLIFFFFVCFRNMFVYRGKIEANVK